MQTWHKKTKTQLTLCRGRHFKIKLPDIGKDVRRAQAIIIIIKKTGEVQEKTKTRQKL